ncbi:MULTISPECIES: DsbA family protein [Staphylococcus]|uniref:DsbA family protein n=1 Tax=Staphylococcus hsinchuensis TaxID=3051183 RepID=A0ABZ3EEF2_9STAP|nr:DsbA family protein [Staphylococcus sp. Marseille-Q6910]
MKKLFVTLCFLLSIIVLSGCNNIDNLHKGEETTKDGKVKIIEYGDYKCSYCKKVEQHVLPKLKENDIDKDKVDYQFVNIAILGDDALLGSRAGHAVQQYAPKQYLAFQKRMFEQQPKSEKNWITKKLIDKQIDALKIDNQKKAKIKEAYKSKQSSAWKVAKKDQQQAKKDGVTVAPTVYVGGEKLEDPYKYANYKRLIDKHTQNDKDN